MKIVLLVAFLLAAFVWVLLNMSRRKAWFAYRHISSPENRERMENLDSQAIHLATWLIALLLLSLGLTWFPLFH